MRDGIALEILLGYLPRHAQERYSTLEWILFDGLRRLESSRASSTTAPCASASRKYRRLLRRRLVAMFDPEDLYCDSAKFLQLAPETRVCGPFGYIVISSDQPMKQLRYLLVVTLANLNFWVYVLFPLVATELSIVRL